MPPTPKNPKSKSPARSRKAAGAAKDAAGAAKEATAAAATGPKDIPPVSQIVTITTDIPFDDFRRHASILASLGDSVQITVRGDVSRIVSALDEVGRHMDIKSAAISLRRPGAIRPDSTPTATLRGDTPVE